jgi:hypothetical protein
MPSPFMIHYYHIPTEGCTACERPYTVSRQYTHTEAPHMVTRFFAVFLIYVQVFVTPQIIPVA